MGNQCPDILALPLYFTLIREGRRFVVVPLQQDIGTLFQTMLFAWVAPVEVRQFNQHFLAAAACRERVYHLRVEAVVAAQKLGAGRNGILEECIRILVISSSVAIQRIVHFQFGLEHAQHLFRRRRSALVATHQASQVDLIIYFAAAVLVRIVILYNRVAGSRCHLILQALQAG